MRSPLAVVPGGNAAGIAAERQISYNPPHADAPPSSVKMPNMRDGGKVAAPAPALESSGLNFIKAAENNFTATTKVSYASTVMRSGTNGMGRKVGKIFAAVLAVALAAAMVLKPAWREALIYRATHLKSDVLQMVRYQRKAPPTHGKSDVDFGDGNPGQARARPTVRGDHVSEGETIERSAVTGKTCRGVIRKSGGGVGEFSVAERIQISECYVLLGDPAGAEDALKPIAQAISHTKESDLNGMRANGTLADGLHLLVQTFLLENKPREADALIGKRCTRWEQSNTCIAKVMTLVDRGLPLNSEATAKLYGTHGKLDGKAQARLWLAGAKSARLENRDAAVDQRFQMALEAAPSGSMMLRKQIFEAEAMDLYYRGEALRLKNLVGQAMSELKSVEEGPKTKLRVLAELSTNNAQRAKVMRGLLSREDITFRARGDFELVDILGPEAIKAHLEESYLALLHRSNDRFSTRYKSSPKAFKRLAAWEIRALLASEKYDRITEVLASYEKTFGVDAFSKHVHGITLMMQSTDRKYQILAAGDFQEALRLRPNWETLVALGVSLVRGGKLEQAASTIRELERAMNTKGQRYWTDMLKAEYYLATQQMPSAKTLLNQWIEQEPGYVTPHRLRLQVWQKLGKTADAETDQNEIDELARKERYVSTREGMSSPIGPMALAVRPVD